jgi:hypothetical protein
MQVSCAFINTACTDEPEFPFAHENRTIVGSFFLLATLPSDFSSVISAVPRLDEEKEVEN